MRYQLQGLFAYEASSEIKARRLQVGSIVELVREPGNQHDKNAVKVLVASSGAKLGYLPKEQAKNFDLPVSQTKYGTVVSVGFNKNYKTNSPYCTIEVDTFVNSDSLIEGRITQFKGVSGVYSIFHIYSMKRYIGSSIDIGERLAQHLYLLRRNNHHSKKLQNDWCQSLENSFDCEIIETVTNKQILLSREQYHIDLTGCYLTGYNSSKYADQTHRYKKSDSSTGESTISYSNYDNYIRSNECIACAGFVFDENIACERCLPKLSIPHEEMELLKMKKAMYKDEKRKIEENRPKKESIITKFFKSIW